ncbi:MAG TPA: hypothetical protein VE889_03320, partial [Actinomycetota bacterium]|nr:hypothetical protein [Actinomycetota bacterium]
MDKRDTERILDEQSLEHHGVLARRHAIRDGIPHDQLDHRIESGDLEVVHRGVLRRRGTPTSYRQRVEAARLSVGDEAVAGRRTAGSLHELVPSWEIEILTTRSRRARPQGCKVIRTNFLPDDHVVTVHGIPVTSVPRTILDLAGVMPSPQALRVVKDAIRLNKTSPSVLAEVFKDSCRPGRPGSAVARSLLPSLDDEGAITESDLEDSMLETIRKAGFPTPIRQLRVFDGDLFIARLDGAYTDPLIALEADGYEWHSARPEWIKDRRRSNCLVAM